MINIGDFEYVGLAKKNTAFTKKGNPYKRTDAFKNVALLSGAAVALKNTIASKDEIIRAGKRYMADANVKCLSENACRAAVAIEKFSSGFAKAGMAALIVGGLIDFTINKIRGAKADKLSDSATFMVK